MNNNSVMNSKYYESYKNLVNYIKAKLVYIHKIRGDEKLKHQGKTIIIKRPYIELITYPKFADYFFKALSQKFIVILRNYHDKSIQDNLETLKNVPLQQNGTIPKSIRDPFKVQIFKPSGQYGIGISFNLKKSGSQNEYIEFYDDLSFYDTKDLRDLEADEKQFKDKVSFLIFAKNIKHNITDILQELNKILTL